MKQPMEMTLYEIEAYLQLHGCGDYDSHIDYLCEAVNDAKFRDLAFQVKKVEAQVRKREIPLTRRERKRQEDFDNVPCVVIL